MRNNYNNKIVLLFISFIIIYIKIKTFLLKSISVLNYVYSPQKLVHPFVIVLDPFIKQFLDDFISTKAGIQRKDRNRRMHPSL